MRRLTLLLLWTLLVLGGYYAVHKPLDLLQAVALLRMGAHLGAAGLYLLLAGGLGAFLYRGETLPAAGRLLVQCALGLGVLAFVWLGVGLAGYYAAGTAWGLLLVGLALLHRPVAGWAREWRNLLPRWRTGNGRLEPLLRGALAVFALVQLLYALAPPLRWDALMYHLEIPRRYLLAGNFAFLPENPYWGQPPLGSLTYTWVMALGSAVAAALLSWAVMTLTTLALYFVWAERTGSRPALVGITALALSLTWRETFSWAYADAFAVLYGAALLILLLQRREDRGNSLLWAAVFGGLALWSKLTALVVLPLLGVVLRPSRLPLRRRLLILALPLLLFLPWMGILMHFTGNPLYPYVWPTPWVDADRMAYFAYRQEPPALLHLLAAPLSAVWFGLEGAVVPGTPGFGADLGAWLVLLAVPGMWAAWRVRSTRWVTAYFGLWWGAAALGGFYSPLLVQPRLYLVLWPGLGFLAALGWRVMASARYGGVRLGRVVSALLALSLCLSLWADFRALGAERPFAPLLGLETESAYVSRTLGPYADAMRAVDALPSASRPLFLWEPRGFYAPPQAAADVWIDRWYLARRGGASAASILADWRAQGYTHLLLYRAGADFELAKRPQFSPADRRALDDLLASLPLLDDFEGVYQLYTLTP